MQCFDLLCWFHSNFLHHLWFCSNTESSALYAFYTFSPLILTNVSTLFFLSQILFIYRMLSDVWLIESHSFHCVLLLFSVSLSLFSHGTIINVASRVHVYNFTTSRLWCLYDHVSCDETSTSILSVRVILVRKKNRQHIV